MRTTETARPHCSASFSRVFLYNTLLQLSVHHTFFKFLSSVLLNALCSLLEWPKFCSKQVKGILVLFPPFSHHIKNKKFFLRWDQYISRIFKNYVIQQGGYGKHLLYSASREVANFNERKFNMGIKWIRWHAYVREQVKLSWIQMILVIKYIA